MSEKNDTSTTNDQEMIVSLLAYLDGQCRPGYRNLVKAIVAQRDALQQRVAEMEAASQPRYIVGGGRVESIDLRERLVCAALTGAMSQDGWMSRDAMAAEVVATAEDTLAAMREETRNA